MKQTPAYILRNCALWADEDSKVGQVSDISLMLPKEQNESFRNGGMIKARKAALGYELDDMEFKLTTALEPATVSLLSGRAGVEHSFMITAALVDEDGTTHSAVYYVRGRVTVLDPGNWKPGEKAELTVTVVQNYAKLDIDNTTIFEIDDFEYTLNGESQTGDIRAALLIG